MIEFNATLLVAMISFVVFMFIMNAIFYTPVLNVIRKREDYIANNYAEAKQINQKISDYQQEKEEKLKNTRIDCRHRVESAIESAQNESNRKTIEQKEKTKEQIIAGKEELVQEAENIANIVNSSMVYDLADIVIKKVLKGRREINV